MRTPSSALPSPPQGLFEASREGFDGGFLFGLRVEASALAFANPFERAAALDAILGAAARLATFGFAFRIGAFLATVLLPTAFATGFLAVLLGLAAFLTCFAMETLSRFITCTSSDSWCRAHIHSGPPKC
jgi:hypothetical protein